MSKCRDTWLLMLGGLGECPPPPMKILNFLKANPAFWAYLKKVELTKKESIFLLLFLKPEALKSLYRSPGYKKNQLALCKNYVLQW